MEIKTEIKAYNIEMLCPECEKGTLKWDGETLRSYPKEYMNACTTCDYVAVLPVPYPHIEIGDEDDREVSDNQDQG